MTATNDITGDSIKTKHNSDMYRDNYDIIFRGKKEEQEETKVEDLADED